jgi:leucine dehydrogenase
MEQLGAHPVACEALLSTPCDILAPVRVGNWRVELAASPNCAAAVAGCANNQLTNLQVADQLERRAFLYAPDYVINSGGLIYMALTHQGAQPETINQHLLQISKRLTGIYAHARPKNVHRPGFRTNWRRSCCMGRTKSGPVFCRLRIAARINRL